MIRPKIERSPLPTLLACICGTRNKPRPYRRGTVSNLWAIQCNACRRRAPAHADPVRMYEAWNDMIAALIQREAFKS